MTFKKPQLFISHAARRDGANPLVAAVLKKLRKQLNNDWEVFVDEYCIKPGSRWRPQILHNLSKSQAGIILFDKNALDNSPWLRAESLILCFRKSIYPNFELIPILFDGLSINDTCFCDYKPFQLNEIQAINIIDKNGKQKSIEDVVKDVKDRLNTELALTIAEEFNGWRLSFKEHLKEIEMHGLIQTWECLPDFNSVKENIHGTDLDRYLLRAITQSYHHFSPFETLSATRVLSLLLKKENPNFKEICRLLIIKWVENESIEVFFNLKRKPKQNNLLTYNTPDDEVIKRLFDRLYYERAIGQSFFPITISKAKIDEVLLSGNQTEKLRNIERLIRDEIETVLGRKGKFSKRQINKSDIYKTECRAERLIVFYLPEKIAEIEIVKNLLKDYEYIIFLVQVSKNDDEFIKLGGQRLTPWLTSEKIEDLFELELELQYI